MGPVCLPPDAGFEGRVAVVTGWGSLGAGEDFALRACLRGDWGSSGVDWPVCWTAIFFVVGLLVCLTQLWIPVDLIVSSERLIGLSTLIVFFD